MDKKKDITDNDTELNLDLDELEVKETPPAAKPKAKPKAAPKGKPKSGSPDFTDEVVAMTDDVPVKLVAVLGHKKVMLKDLLNMKVGQAIDLERAPNEFVDIEANGKVVARGELIEIDGKLGVRIIKLSK